MSSSRERYIAWYRSEYGGRDPADGVTTAWKAWQARDPEVAELVEVLRLARIDWISNGSNLAKIIDALLAKHKGGK